MTMPFVSIVRLLLPAAVAGSGVPAADAVQRHRPDQRAAMEAQAAGRILPLREIEKRVVPRMRGADYLGFDFDPASGIYTLKFLRDGAVIWVDVDGSTAQVLRSTGR